MTMNVGVEGEGGKQVLKRVKRMDTAVSLKAAFILYLSIENERTGIKKLSGNADTPIPQSQGFDRVNTI